MLLGPVPGVSGLYAACGFNSNGMALAPAAGRYIAEWIVEGAPSIDVAALDVRRFSALQSDPGYLRERVTEIPGYHCRMHSADDDYRTARGMRLSPLHAEQSADGAVFASVNGWERAAWFKQRETTALWLEAVSEEFRAAVEGCLLVDRSSDVKYLIEGTSAREWLEECAPSLFPKVESQISLAAMRGDRGQVEALVRVLEQVPDRCLLSASADQETRLGEWLRRRLPAGFRSLDRTHDMACLELRGPARAAWLRQAIQAEEIEGLSVREDALQDSTVVTCRRDSGALLWGRLRALGRTSGLLAGGHLVEQALRIARGVPEFGREITPATRIDELTGNRGARRILAFAISIPRLGSFSRDVILLRGRAVGELTSRMRIPGWPNTFALGRLDVDCAPASAYETVVDGLTWPLVPRDSAWQHAAERVSE
jgi:hypothetical protein